MKVIFTKNNSILSRFIRWGAKEPVSHLAVVFDNKIVFHSNFKGLHIEWYETFKKHNEVVFDIEYDLYLEDEEIIYQDIITKYDGRSYDYAGLMYLIIKGVSNKLFKTPMPINNKWASGNRDMCIEIMAMFGVKDSLDTMTPFQVYNLLKEKQNERTL